MIPVSKPLIAKNAEKYLLACLSSGWVSSAGPFVKEFEKKFAHFIGVKYAVACNSGTAALHLSLAALRIQDGDEVIVPSLTMIASILPILYQGATPVLVDVEKDTGNIDPGLIEEKITKRTKAIMVVHLHGHPADMGKIMQLAKKYKLAVIEDAAEAHGAKWQMSSRSASPTGAAPGGANGKPARNASQSVAGGWKMVGSIGDTGCFSFYGNKIITTGEGGIVTTNSTLLADRMKNLRNFARTPGAHFLHQEIGFAYRMSNLQAALGLAQIEEATDFVEKKRHIASLYTKLLTTDSLMLPAEKNYAKSVYWHYAVLFRSEKIKNHVATHLQKSGIETRPVFTPMHKQPALLKKGYFLNERYPVAEILAQTGLCLPSGLAITDTEIKRVCTLVNQIL